MLQISVAADSWTAAPSWGNKLVLEFTNTVSRFKSIAAQKARIEQLRTREHEVRSASTSLKVKETGGQPDTNKFMQVVLISFLPVCAGHRTTHAPISQLWGLWFSERAFLGSGAGVE